ncbi:MAG: hypothetical protein ACREE6_02665 [Limisphaerales bacterium]
MKFFTRFKFVLLRLAKVSVVFALVAVLSAHWALLQTVAWTTMLASNLESCSLHDAVARTFDGRHPCPLCRAIAAAKKSQQKNHSNLRSEKLQFAPLPGHLVLTAPSPVKIPSENGCAESVSQKPPTPPPRGFFV